MNDVTWSHDIRSSDLPAGTTAPAPCETEPRASAAERREPPAVGEPSLAATSEPGQAGHGSGRPPAHDPYRDGGTADASVDLVDPLPPEARPRFIHRPRPWRWKHVQQARPYPSGLWWHGMTSGRGGAREEDLRLCGPLEVTAMVDGPEEAGYSLELCFRDILGRERRLLVSRGLLADGRELERILLTAGVDLEPGRAYRQLVSYLRKIRPERCLKGVRRLGWAEDRESFVLPDRVLGADRYRLVTTLSSGPGVGGEIGKWRDAIALLEGNPLPAFAVMLALAGPLFRLAGRGSGGIHLYGPTTSGKSTTLQLAASVWGHPRQTVRTWNATFNGIEAVATVSNDMLLALDEISEVQPETVEKVIYLVGNDTGRLRANRNGGLRAVEQWRVAWLSAGERSLGDYLTRAGRRPQLGIHARLLDVPTDAPRACHGVFDELHGRPSAQALAEHLAAEVLRHHGHAGPVLVQHLLEHDGTARLKEMYALARESLARSGSTPLEDRAATIFALAQVAGTLALEARLLPWTKSFIEGACRHVYERWHGTPRPRDPADDVAARVRQFIERHGASRFTPKHDPDRTIRDRAGWYEEDGEGGRRIWLFTEEGLSEAAAMNATQAAHHLAAAGLLIREGGGHLTTKRTIEGTRRRVYAVRLLDDGVQGEPAEDPGCGDDRADDPENPFVRLRERLGAW